eukprot:gene15249-16823_t
MPLNIPAVPVKYFLIAHFVLTTWQGNIGPMASRMLLVHKLFGFGNRTVGIKRQDL